MEDVLAAVEVDEAGPENDRGEDPSLVLTDAGGLNIIEGIRGREEEVGIRDRPGVVVGEAATEASECEIEEDLGIRLVEDRMDMEEEMLAEEDDRLIALTEPSRWDPSMDPSIEPPYELETDGERILERRESGFSFSSANSFISSYA